MHRRSLAFSFFSRPHPLRIADLVSSLARRLSSLVFVSLRLRLQRLPCFTRLLFAYGRQSLAFRRRSPGSIPRLCACHPRRQDRHDSIDNDYIIYAFYASLNNEERVSTATRLRLSLVARRASSIFPRSRLATILSQASFPCVGREPRPFCVSLLCSLHSHFLSFCHLPSLPSVYCGPCHRLVLGSSSAQLVSHLQQLLHFCIAPYLLIPAGCILLIHAIPLRPLKLELPFPAFFCPCFRLPHVMFCSGLTFPQSAALSAT